MDAPTEAAAPTGPPLEMARAAPPAVLRMDASSTADSETLPVPVIRVLPEATDASMVSRMVLPEPAPAPAMP